MKNRRGVLGILFVTGLLLCWGTKVYASTEWAGVTAVLTANQTSVTSYGADPFQATYMYGAVQSASEHDIMFVTWGGNTYAAKETQEALITIRPGGSNTVSINSTRNYHALVLTGKNGLTTVKGCIGNGWVEMQ